MSLVVHSVHFNFEILQYFVCLHSAFCRPYRRDKKVWKINDFSNTMEFVVLTLLILQGLYVILQKDVLYGFKFGCEDFGVAVFAIVTVVQLGVYLHEFVVSWRDTLSQRPRYTLSKLWEGDLSLKSDSSDMPGSDSNLPSSFPSADISMDTKSSTGLPNTPGNSASGTTVMQVRFFRCDPVCRELSVFRK